MSDIEDVIEKIQGAFAGNEHPGGRFLQGSFEGCEPYEEVGPFENEKDWRGIGADFLDGHANALSFFSEAGFRYFLPAYLISDLRGELYTADPLFHLTHGFSDWSTEVPAGDRTLAIKHGKSAFINPRRYGAMTSYDYARHRLSIFTRRKRAPSSPTWSSSGTQTPTLSTNKPSTRPSSRSGWRGRGRHPRP